MVETCGILLFRRKTDGLEVFLAHPGGPFWARKDDGAWTIPKGLREKDEEPLAAAKREFTEETGFTIDGDLIGLGVFRQPGGKRLAAWAVEGDCDAAQTKSNLFTMEWPPKSGRMQEFPEIDRGGWFALDMARQKILKGQAPLLDRLVELLAKEP